MKKGDVVCVKVLNSFKKAVVLENKKDSVKVGIGLHFDGTKQPNYYEEVLSKNNIKRFIPISEEDAEKFHKSQFSSLSTIILDLQSKYFPQKKVEIDDMTITIGDVSVGPCVMEVESIGRVSECAGWNVDITHYGDTVYGYPDVDVVDVGNYRDYAKAAICFMKHVFEREMQAYLLKIGEEAYAASIMDDMNY